MRLIVLSMTTLLTGSLFVVYGTLLAWRPDLFLRFHDSFISRGSWNKNAEWRKNVYNLDYKVLGDRRAWLRAVGRPAAVTGRERGEAAVGGALQNHVGRQWGRSHTRRQEMV